MPVCGERPVRVETDQAKARKDFESHMLGGDARKDLICPLSVIAVTLILAPPRLNLAPPRRAENPPAPD